MITVSNHDNDNRVWEHLVHTSTECPLRAWHAVLFRSILTATLAGRYYHSAHFADEETEAQDLSELGARNGQY